MKNNSIIVIVIAIVFAWHGRSQSTIDTVLSAVSKHNKTLIAYAQYQETQKLRYGTGLTPYDPTISYDYMKGTPSTAGNQTDITVVQKFDFPTAYTKKKQVSEQQTARLEFQRIAQKQDILLKVKKICIDLVYHNKLQGFLAARKNDIEKLLSDFQAKLDNGEGTILDVNKARLQHIAVAKEVQENQSSIHRLNQQLTGLNGGNTIVFTDTIYPEVPDIPPFEILESVTEANDPVKKILEQEQLVAQKQLELSKALALPKIELGYRYQGILGQDFHGIHTGISLPLWEHKNTVKAQKASASHADLVVQDHTNEHYHEIRRLYERYTNLKITLSAYESVFSTLNNTELLNKALASGYISTIAYFMEMRYYYDTLYNYLKTEKEFYTVIAELFKYQL